MCTYFFGHAACRNFAKFLCDSDGIPVKRYSPKESPMSFEDDIVSLVAASKVDNKFVTKQPEL